MTTRTELAKVCLAICHCSGIAPQGAGGYATVADPDLLCKGGERHSENVRLKNFWQPLCYNNISITVFVLSFFVVT